MPSPPPVTGPPSPSLSVAAPFLASIPDNPISYDVLLTSLSTIATTAIAAWSTADINIAATMAVGDFDLSSLTRGQVTAVSIAIREARPPYPIVNPHRRPHTPQPSSALLRRRK